MLSGDNGLFVAMPSRKTATGDYRDIVHPISQEARDIVEGAILKEYETAEDVAKNEDGNEEDGDVE